MRFRGYNSSNAFSIIPLKLRAKIREIICKVLSEPEWKETLQAEDLRALTALVYTHFTSYGQFRPDMNKRIAIESALVAYPATISTRLRSSAAFSSGKVSLINIPAPASLPARNFSFVAVRSGG